MRLWLILCLLSEVTRYRHKAIIYKKLFGVPTVEKSNLKGKSYQNTV